MLYPLSYKGASQNAVRIVAQEMLGSVTDHRPRLSELLGRDARMKHMPYGRGAGEKASALRYTSDMPATATIDKEYHVTPDGVSWYTPDFETLVGYEGTGERLEIDARCKTIGSRALAYHEELREVVFPEGLEVIEAYALLSCGIERFEAPPHLREIREKGFYRCENLAEVTLNEGLLSIGFEAFGITAITSLYVPASVEYLGTQIVNGTRITKEASPMFVVYNMRMTHDSGKTRLTTTEGTRVSTLTEEPDAGTGDFTISPENKHYKICSSNGLYHLTDEGAVLYDATLVRDAVYTVEPGTVGIAPKAFFLNTDLEQVNLPEGLRFIGDNAFFRCRNLSKADLPSTIEVIGKQAFADTVIPSVYLPASVRVIHGDSYLRECPPAQTRDFLPVAIITVDPDNPQLFMSSGLLCEHVEGGTHVVCYASRERTVEVPADTVSFSAYAFLRATGIDVLHLHEGNWDCAPSTFAAGIPPRELYLYFAEPRDGRDHIRVVYEQSENGSRCLVSGFANCGPLMEYGLPPSDPSFFSDIKSYAKAAYEKSKHSTRGLTPLFESRAHLAESLLYFSDEAIYKHPDLFVRFSESLNRLADPYLMASKNYENLDRMIALNQPAVWREFAKHHHWHGFEQLVDLGYVNAENIDDMVEGVGNSKDNEAISFALEFKRKLFGQTSFSKEEFSL